MVSDAWRNKVGILAGSEYNQRSNRWLHRVYFKYDDELMRELKSSSLFSVLSHGSKKDKEMLSIVRTVYTEVVNRRIIDLDEKHMEGMAVNPERQTDVAKEVFEEMMKGVSEETFISIMVQQTGLSVDDWEDFNVKRSSQRPRVGATVSILNKKGLDAIYNTGIDDGSSVALGKLRGVDVPIKLDVRKMVTTHSGVFGFTGAGKSNMVSNIIRKLVGEGKGNANVVVFDIEEEYGALLADCYVDENKFVVFVDDSSISPAMKDYMMGKSHDANESAREYVEQMTDKMPHELAGSRDDFIPVFERMLAEKRFRVLAEKEVANMKEFITVVLGHWSDVEGIGSGGESNISGIVSKMQDWKDKLAKGEGEIKGFEQAVTVKTLNNFKKFYLKEYEKEYNAGGGRVQAAQVKRDDFNKIDDWIERKTFEEGVANGGFLMSREKFQDLCQNTNQDSLVVLQGEKDEVMFRMVGELITDKANGIFELRKTKNTFESPITLFVFDEADRFLPQSIGKEQKEKLSPRQEAQIIAREAVRTLVRRGRKIKLGSMIATQRTTYMDTTVLGQIHTYFVNHLPRQVDRQRISEGFGLSEEDVARTSEFGPGEWMILSNNATGLKNVPIIVEADNANDAIEEYIKSYKKKLKI